MVALTGWHLSDLLVWICGGLSRGNKLVRASCLLTRHCIDDVAQRVLTNLQQVHEKKEVVVRLDPESWQLKYCCLDLNMLQHL